MLCLSKISDLNHSTEKRARTIDGTDDDVEASRKQARMDADLGGMDDLDQNWFIPDEYGGGDDTGESDITTHLYGGLSGFFVLAAQHDMGGEGATIFDARISILPLVDSAG